MTSPIRRGTRIAHIGIAVRSLDALLPLYRDVLGLPEVPLDDADGARIAGLAAGESLVELLEPEAAGSPIDKFIEKRGPGIHHLCLAVDDLTAHWKSAARQASLSSIPYRGLERRANASPSCTPNPRAVC